MPRVGRGGRRRGRRKGLSEQARGCGTRGQRGRAAAVEPNARNSTEKVTKTPAQPPDMSVYDFESSASSAGADDSGEDSSSAAQHEKDMREDIRKMLQEVGVDITQALLARRKQFEMNTSASLKTINEKIEHILKTQQDQRHTLHYRYSQQFLPLLQQWDMNVQKAEEQEEKLASMFQEQRKLFLQARTDQHEKVKEMKNLYEQLLKPDDGQNEKAAQRLTLVDRELSAIIFAHQLTVLSDINLIFMQMHGLKDLEEDHENSVVGEQSKVKEEMAELQEKFMRETQRQEVAVVKKSLQSLLE